MNNSVAFDFSGAGVVVTGGTSGIGHAIAVAFAAAGADVTVTGTRTGPSEYETDIAGLGFHQLQMGDPESIESFVDSMDRLDILVNNAGANMPGGIDEWDPDGFTASVELNLLGPVRLTLGAGRLLFASTLAGGASVVNLASMSALRATPIVPGYASAKAATVAFTANLANRWAGRGVRVNAVAPGLIDTPMTEPMAAFPELLESELAKIPMRRMGGPEEIVGSVQFLCSAAASYVTGHTFAVDGGYLAG